MRTTTHELSFSGTGAVNTPYQVVPESIAALSGRVHRCSLERLTGNFTTGQVAIRDDPSGDTQMQDIAQLTISLDGNGTTAALFQAGVGNPYKGPIRVRCQITNGSGAWTATVKLTLRVDNTGAA